MSGLEGFGVFGKGHRLQVQGFERIAQVAVRVWKIGFDGDGPGDEINGQVIVACSWAIVPVILCLENVVHSAF